MKVLTAIRITISIPFIFTSVTHNDSIYVDGFVTDNYPIQYAMQHYEGPFLGIFVKNNKRVEIKNLETFMYNLCPYTIRTKKISKLVKKYYASLISLKIG